MQAHTLFDVNAAFSVVDVETTGGKSKAGHIIEIGIVTIKDQKIVDTYSSLLRPSQDIPPFISELTGIRNADVAHAPAFGEIKDEIRARLEDRHFVAHNARFDYQCLKTEFEMLGDPFYKDLFCTDKLGRKFFPGHRHYNLDAMIERMHIPVGQRHRSLGDALATAQIFLTYLMHPDSRIIFSNYVRSFDKTEKWFERLESHIEKLPNGKGVYIFKDAHDLPLYIGKSNHIRSRVLSHLREDGIPRKKRLLRYTDHFDVVECSSELESLILESRLIKKHLPPYNIEQTVRKGYTFIKITSDPYPRILTSRVKNEKDPCAYIGPFRSSKFARFLLDNMQRHFKLCPELMKERRAKKGFCFSYSLGLCCGACGGAVSEEDYRRRVNEAADMFRHFVHMENEEIINTFLRSQSTKTPELQDLRSSLRRVKKHINETPEVFHEKYLAIDDSERVGYFIRNGLLEKVLRPDELEDPEGVEALATSVQIRAAENPDTLDERLTIRRFVSANKNKLRIVAMIG